MNFDKLLDTNVLCKLVNFANGMIKTYGIDNSHGLEHCFGTMNHAGVIVNYYLAREIHLIIGISQERSTFIIKVISFIHDMMDDKYISHDKLIEAEKNLSILFDKLSFTDEEVGIIKEIINNMSYSKRQKARAKGMDIDLGPYQLALEIVRDADLLEGYKIDRCRQYSIHNKPNVGGNKQLDQEVYNIISQRVFSYLERDISTEIGKIMARPLHDTLEIQLQIKNELPKFNN